MSNLFLFLSLRIILHPCPPFEARLGFSKKQGFLLEAFSGGEGRGGGRYWPAANYSGIWRKDWKRRSTARDEIGCAVACFVCSRCFPADGRFN